MVPLPVAYEVDLLASSLLATGGIVEAVIVVLLTPKTELQNNVVYREYDHDALAASLSKHFGGSLHAPDMTRRRGTICTSSVDRGPKTTHVLAPSPKTREVLEATAHRILLVLCGHLGPYLEKCLLRRLSMFLPNRPRSYQARHTEVRGDGVVLRVYAMYS